MNNYSNFNDYTIVTDFIDGYAIVKANGKWGVINEKGQKITEIEYDGLIFRLNKKKKLTKVFFKIGKKRGYFDIKTKEEVFENEKS